MRKNRRRDMSQSATNIDEKCRNCNQRHDFCRPWYHQKIYPEAVSRRMPGVGKQLVSKKFQAGPLPERLLVFFGFSILADSEPLAASNFKNFGIGRFAADSNF